MSDPSPPRFSLRTKIITGLLLGATCGVLTNLFLLPSFPNAVEGALTYVAQPVGQVFLNMLLMTVVPLVLASLAAGVAQLGDLRKLGRIGGKTLGLFLLSMGLAVGIGLPLVNIIAPGERLDEQTRQELDEMLSRNKKDVEEKGTSAEPFGVNTFVNIVPRNPIKAAADMQMLQIIFFALMLGIALTRIPQEYSEPFIKLLQTINELMVTILGMAMQLAPYAVFALIFNVTARLGLNVVYTLGGYIFVVVLGLAIHLFVTLPLLVRLFTGMHPLTFLRKARGVLITAFSTSSSSATLPTTMRTAQEEYGVPPQVVGFVVPLGATMNMNGTALFEGVTAVFLAELAPNVDLGLGQQLILVVLAVITSIGAAGVPGGSIPLLIMVISSVGVPGEYIAVILGVDRLLDMCRTTLNVGGDLAATVIVSKSEGYPLRMDDAPLPQPAPALVPATEPATVVDNKE